MSDDLIIFGTPFPSIENDNKNYVPVWKQKAVSTKGTKRFHGAFEGGFSAGYFNSVGSKEGWKPSEFISSRDKRYEKNESINNFDKIENYMDEEDMIEFNSKELIYIDHMNSDDIRNILNLNGISENSNFAAHEDHLQLVSKYMKPTSNPKKSNIRETSEAFSGGGAWDEDDERPEFYEKDSSLHQVAELIESSDQNLDEMITLAFGNVNFISTENPFHKIEIPSDYIPRKIIGSSNVEIINIKKSEFIDKNKAPTDGKIFDVDEKTASAALKGFMPFDEDPEKQTRYIKYLRFCNNKSTKPDVPKSTLYLDEKEREEFIMSAQIFKPPSSVISSRFESSSTSLQPQIQLKAGLSRPNIEKKLANPKEIEPLRIDQPQPKSKNVESFGQRINFIWAPSSLLCKRFNVTPPDTGLTPTFEPKRAKPALADESIEQMVNVLLKDSKNKMSFESEKKNQETAEESLPILPSNDIFEEIFGPSTVETRLRENRPKATDYFESRYN